MLGVHGLYKPAALRTPGPTWIGSTAYVLAFDRQVEVIADLTEGVRVRATERLTGIQRDTIMRLGVRVGRCCDILHHGHMCGVRVSRLGLDEAWFYVGKKQKRVTDADREMKGDQ
jgi:hypothetical protein